MRVICPHCKVEVKATRDQLVESGLDPDIWSKIPIYEGRGCFGMRRHRVPRGRTAIHELLDLTEEIRELILTKRPTSEIKRAAKEQGMTFLRESAVYKVREGVSTLKEINKVTFID